MKTKLFILMCLIIQSYSYAQEHAWVYFKDKKGVEEALKNPITILTQRAIDRKAKYNVAIDERDVPVNPEYIKQIKNKVTVKAKSKWFNCVHVVGSKSKITALKDLDFVKDIEFANRSLNTKQSISLTKDKFAIEVEYESEEYEMTDFDYGKAANQVKMIKSNALHQKGYTGKGMIIAVIDDGFPNVDKGKGFARMRETGKILGTYDFVKKRENVYSIGGHGTKVLSDIAGYVEGKFAGTAPDASFYLFRTEDDGGETPAEESYWVEATERADSLGVDVTNTSLGYHDYDNKNYSYKKSEMDGKTAFASRAANIALEKGLLSVGSAGNSGDDSWGIITVPGDAEGIFTIGAVDSRGNYARFSSRGSSAQPTQKPDVMAKGQSSAIINERDKITTVDGTSFSSPIMCGGVTCLWQSKPYLNNKQIMQLIRESASLYDNPNFKMGFGIPNLETALLSNTNFELDAHVKVYPNPASKYVAIDLLNAANTAEVSIYNVLGKKLKVVEITKNNASVDISDLINGVYILNIKVGKATKTVKLIKK